MSNSNIAVFASQFNVYTPNGYKQLNRIQNGPGRLKINGEAIELLVDYSGSMRKWIGTAKETLNYILPQIPYSSAVSLRVFGESVADTNPYPSACQATRQIASFKKENQSNITKGLDEAKIGGITPIEFALRKTVDEDLSNIWVYDRNTTHKKKKIVLVTDGSDNCGGDPCAYVRELIKTRKDIQIDVIQLGSNNKLMCLSAETGGSFYQVNGSREKFETAFESTFKVPQGTIAKVRYAETSTYKQNTPRYDAKSPLAKKYKYVNQ